MEINYNFTGKIVNGKFVIPLSKDEYEVSDIGDTYLIIVKKPL